MVINGGMKSLLDCNSILSHFIKDSLYLLYYHKQAYDVITVNDPITPTLITFFIYY